MVKARQTQPQAKQEQTRRAHHTAPDTTGAPTRLPPLEAPLLDYTPEQVMALQRQVGNQATLQRMQVPLQRAPEYQEGTSDTGKAIDPEQAIGVLPFTPEGWDGRAIAATLSQLNVEAPETDAVRCVQTSFLVGLILLFASLYPEPELTRLVKELKGFQDVLGGFNDMELQRARFVAIADELIVSGHARPEALFAVGRLVDAAAARQDDYRREVADRFSSFSSRDSRALYARLFGGG